MKLKTAALKHDFDDVFVPGHGGKTCLTKYLPDDTQSRASIKTYTLTENAMPGKFLQWPIRKASGNAADSGSWMMLSLW
jgi:hypothetical protein